MFRYGSRGLTQPLPHPLQIRLFHSLSSFNNMMTTQTIKNTHAPHMLKIYRNQDYEKKAAKAPTIAARIIIALTSGH
jgi:hypothetical protein